MFGLEHFWQQSSAIIHAVALLLLLMSIFSWYIILTKTLSLLHYRNTINHALKAFWQADSRLQALELLSAADKTNAFSKVAADAINAADAYEKNTAQGIGAGVEANDFIMRTLQQSIVIAQARIESGLTFLASVGSTAPFVGLFGTVWGIYHALVGLAGATQVVLDKVAGPVGEALIMTAAGLFVAIPAVLAYNAFTRANRLVLAQLDGFAHSLHAYLVSGMKLTLLQKQKNVTPIRPDKKGVTELNK